MSRSVPTWPSSPYTPIGAVTREPPLVAAPAHWRFTALDGTQAQVSVLADDLACVRLLPPGVEPAPSFAVVDREWPEVKIAVRDDLSAGMTLTTQAMIVEISTDPFRVSFAWPDGIGFAVDDEVYGMGYVPGDVTNPERPAGSVRCHKRLPPGERILGAGESTAPLDRRGQRIVYWNTDPPQPHGDDTRAMYVSLPFWLGQRSGRCYGIFFDTVRRSDLDAGATWSDVLSFGADGGDLTYYVLAGPTPAKVLARYADITGHIPLPPRWSLGYGQSRWSYYPAEIVREVADGFRLRRIPCDSLWLDIDYMDGYRVFTWNPRRFPDPEALLRELGASGYKIVAIIDPGVKADPTDPTYVDGLERDYFVRRADGSHFTGIVWPGESVFPDFSRAEVRAWWGKRHRPLLAAGIDGIWDDMNEPSLTDRLVPGGDTPHGTTLPLDAVHLPDGPDSPPLSHAAFHNAYGLQMARATYEAQADLHPGRRPFVLTRSGYAGIQRYAFVWTGDNQSAWEHLRLASRMCLALGLGGLPLVGFDTGGFWKNADGELLVRFTQLGSVFPFFRNHSAFGTANQEPWAFGQPFEALCRRAIELRYQLLPYIYTAVATSRLTGAPIARALAYAYPDEEALLNVDDEHLLGADLLCAPVMEPDQPRRTVQFPPGAWIDWETGERVMGPERRQVDSPLDVLPLFVREGAILPMGPVMQFVGELADEPLTLACYPAARESAVGELYEDDGETTAYQRDDYRRTRLTAGLTDGRVTFRAEPPQGSYLGVARTWTVEFHLPYRIGDKRPVVASAHVDGRPLDIAGIAVVSRRYETLLSVPLGLAGAPCSLELLLA